MANTLELAEQYTKVLDSGYVYASLTSDLEVRDELTKGFDEAGTVKIMSIVTNGLGDYSRDTGFPTGDVTTTWESFEIENDRGREFSIDVMDNEEGKKMAFASTAKEFITQHVAPEVDAIRFSKMSSKASTTVAGALADGDALIDAIDTAGGSMDDAEVPVTGRRLYLSNASYRLLKKAGQIVREISVEGTGAKSINRNVESFDDMPITRVPASRFNTAITLDADGFTQTGKAMDFMILHSSSAKAVTRHKKVRVFGADVNQDKDADKYQYRIYHDILVPANKTAGIYVHTAV